MEGTRIVVSVRNDLEAALVVHGLCTRDGTTCAPLKVPPGYGKRVTPMIGPGGSFIVRFTPPRAGTFIYHTHLHDYRQLSSGLYGPVIVTDANEPYDPDTDHVFVLGRKGLTSEEPSVLTEPESVVINGERTPRFVWKAGARHRARLINITPDDIFSVSLLTSDGPVQWTPVAKDGAPLPAAESVSTTARQTIAVGETYEFEYLAPAGRKSAWLDVRTPGGKWQVQGHVIIKSRRRAAVLPTGPQVQGPCRSTPCSGRVSGLAAPKPTATRQIHIGVRRARTTAQPKDRSGSTPQRRGVSLVI